MQFLITVNDPENGLGSGTERAFTDQITQMVGMWDRFPDVTATIEVHEQDVYGSEEGVLHCDFCAKVEYADDLTTDWNGETGNHLSCEAREAKPTALCFVCMVLDGTTRETGHEGNHGAMVSISKGDLEDGFADMEASAY